MKWRKRQLWWLLVPLFLCLTLIGIQYSRFCRQQTAIRQIEQLGGQVVTTHGEPRWLLRFLGGKALRIFEQATLVNLSQTEVTDSDLKLLFDLQGLQRLNLSATGITDDGLSQVAGLTDLQALDLSDTKISAKGLPHLRGLVSLRYLYLHRTSIVVADLQSLSNAIPNCDIDCTLPESKQF